MLEAPEVLKTEEPIAISASLAFSLAFSLLSPSLSKIPPDGRKAFNAWRIVAESLTFNALENDDDSEGDNGLWDTSNGNRGIIADRVAVVKCWLGVRRHPFSPAIKPSVSEI